MSAPGDLAGLTVRVRFGDDESLRQILAPWLAYDCSLRGRTILDWYVKAKISGKRE